MGVLIYFLRAGRLDGILTDHWNPFVDDRKLKLRRIAALTVEIN